VAGGEQVVGKGWIVGRQVRKHGLYYLWNTGMVWSGLNLS
jgi:hypothetical protein